MLTGVIWVIGRFAAEFGSPCVQSGLALLGWRVVGKCGAVIDGALLAVGLFVMDVWWSASVVGVLIAGERVVGLWVDSSQVCTRIVRVA